MHRTPAKLGQIKQMEVIGSIDGFKQELDRRVLRTKLIVLFDTSIAFPGVCEPYVGSVDGGEILDGRVEFANLGLESGVSEIRVSRSRTAWKRTREAISRDGISG